MMLCSDGAAFFQDAIAGLALRRESERRVREG